MIKRLPLSRINQITFALLFVFLFLISACSPNKNSYNLDFEQHVNGFPTLWKAVGDKEFKVYVDSSQKIRGKFSTVIENTSDKIGYKSLFIILPNNYEGKTIRLSGFIKTENVTDGFAGLRIRIDPEIAIDDMSDRGVNGTTDWKKFEITLPLKPKDTEKIIIGGKLVGKGKMWIDGLTVHIDGMELDNPKLKLHRKQIFAAQSDQAFDKGSKIIIPKLNQGLIYNLELLGKIWGLMKYHHPEIAKGKYNWDYELFRFLPQYLAVKDKDERDNALSTWIRKYGISSACKTCKPTSAEAVLKPDRSWINAANIAESLKTQLTEIYNNRNQGYNYYIGLHSGILNPKFTNERPYEEMKYPDAGFRLLSLYRYWNIIQYFFPNRHLTDKRWDTILNEYIPKFVDAKDELAYELATLQVIGEINDTHANLWEGGDKISQLRGDRFAPFKAKFVENKFVVVDYFNPEYSGSAKVKIGDVITHIDGKSVASHIDSLKSYYPASNRSAMLRDISIDLLRSQKDKISLQYLSEKGLQRVDVPTYESKELQMYYWHKVDVNEKSYKLLDANIGYVTLANIKKIDIPEIKKSFKDTRGIIIDIRNHPYSSAISLVSYFVNEPTSFVKFTIGNPNNPGEFTFLKEQKIKSDNVYYKGKLVVLVNENSQSASETIAMAFKATKNAVIIGSTTAGANGDISRIALPGDLKTGISGLGTYYPNGKETQRVGIIPDIVVKPTIKGIKNGKDEVLERAIKVINQQ